ncbi:41010_t:CDS:2 [Gigaspora margarita]|uniref:41010_t:CDS:1 n=1 Tax=Gigaspora margarita TaxID=4874 RepID=A0ABN7UZS8_GIGMA|nr:41010_t:CDS:2 [Gigaspora margarita]
MECISLYIKEGSKVSILGNVVSKSISHPILEDILDASPDVEVEVLASHMKFVAVSNDNSNERNEVLGGPKESNELETDFSIGLNLCSIHDRKDMVLLASCSTTNLKTEINRYIKNYGNVKFLRPVIFDEYNEYRSGIDILNNLRDNALSYHDVLQTKCSENQILAFYFSITEANSFSAYCQFISEKKNTRYVDFQKQLAASILEYYSTETLYERTKKRKRQNNEVIEHNFDSLQNDPTTK